MDIAKQIEPIRAKVKTEAKKVVEIMAKEYDIEDQYAKAALETAVEDALQGDNESVSLQQDLSWISPKKPASKSEVALSKAEDFLSSLIEEDEQEAQSSTQETAH